METSQPRIVGIYDADSTLWGEVSYWIGARFGRRHCSLCDVTHGMFTKKRSWDDCAAQLSHPFVTYHRNDMPDHLRPIVGNSFPAIVFDDVRQPRILLTDSDITGAKGSPESLVRLIGDALAVLPPQS